MIWIRPWTKYPMTFLPMHQNALKLKKYRTDYILVAAASLVLGMQIFPSHGMAAILYCIVVKLLWWNRKDFWQEVSMAKVDCPANWAFVPYCVHQPHHHLPNNVWLLLLLLVFRPVFQVVLKKLQLWKTLLPTKVF